MDVRSVRTLADSNMSAGSHDVVWDGLDASGRGLDSGLYLARLALGGRSRLFGWGRFDLAPTARRRERYRMNGKN